MLREELIRYLDDLLKPWLINDYAPNGLQVEGKDTIRKVVTAVTADQFAVDAAVAANADVLLVHHGYFWKSEPAPITGMKKRRIEQLIKHDINLIAYHLPLDVHPELGNNAELAKALGVVNVRAFEEGNDASLVLRGELDPPLTGHQLAQRISDALSRPPLHIAGHDRPIRTLAWCTGGAQDYIDGVAAAGLDAFLSGEVSERTYHSAVEQGIDYYACGHHATERGGVKALGERLGKELGLEVSFVDTPNPV
ncbi:Nif3-like dinuclear metal center hexameric protein [Ferrimonas balearica]|uniref:Nif3-like dinuclear metal center hexameric protein n=1 Tax=Ferrimonas balearica TaxID=44012 RepID=UPI001C997445|nr:Nif3-like dinuclear metal center hexameric protein [Ferrimonas balearica]MBY5920473.1 Nif3-like dinuclear metal center hexameric protein [Ferrimonas balearica]MBY5996842.1 Nif3-like dinuclear metal center hexameric protein [Ferrimonas balearica]